MPSERLPSPNVVSCSHIRDGQRDVRAGKHRPTQIQVGAQTSQGAALERDIRWLQAHLESTISFGA